MSDPPHDMYATVAQVKRWAPYNVRDYPDPTVEDLIESASREVILKTGKKWDITEEAYDDIEIITCYLVGVMIQTTEGDVEKAKWFRDLAYGKIKTLTDRGAGEGGSGASDTINVYSQPRSYHLAMTLDPSQTVIKPYRSRY